MLNYLKVIKTIIKNMFRTSKNKWFTIVFGLSSIKDTINLLKLLIHLCINFKGYICKNNLIFVWIHKL